MFSKNPDYPRKRISLQLSIWYTTIFLLTFVSLFAAAFVILHTTLKQRDHEFILDELSEYTSRYDKSGLESTITEIKFESGVPANKSFFVRIADPVNHTLFLSAPENWDGFDLLQLEKQLPKPNKKWMRLSKQDDEDVMEIAFARLKDGRMMEVGMSSGNRNEQLERFWRFSGLLFPIALIGILGGSFLSFRALRPIHHLITTVRSVVDTGNMEARVPTRQTGDEMDELSKLFNRMFDKVDVLIKSMKDSLDNVAHDLRTPLTRLRAVSEEALESDRDIEKYQEALVTCLEESQQAITMLKALMDIAEAEAGTLKLTLQPIDISDVIQEVVDLYKDLADEKNIQVTQKLKPGIAISADRIRLRQALANLLDNAVKYTSDGGKIEIESRQENNEAIITMRDTGVGISPNDLPKIWDRLYRGDHSRTTQGLGLGLSVVKAIAHAHQGKIGVTSTPGQGSLFTISLPFTVSPSQIHNLSKLQ